MTMNQLESKMFEAIRETTIRDIGNDELAGYIRGIVDFDLELRKVLEKGGSGQTNTSINLTLDGNYK